MTNGYTDMNLLSEHMKEFTDLIDFYVQAADCGAQKPSIVPFINVLYKASSSLHQHQSHDMVPPYDPKKILFIGDSYSKDVLGARNVGMKSVWLVRPAQEGEDNSISALYYDKYHTNNQSINEEKLISLEPDEIARYISRLT